MDALKFTEVGEIEAEPQGLFPPETIPDDGVVYSRRWRAQRTDRLWVIVTYYCGPMIPENGDSGGFDLQEATEFVLCEDPDEVGGSEVDSDIEYDHPNYQLIDPVENANREARRYVAGFNIDLFVSVADVDVRSVNINR